MLRRLSDWNSIVDKAYLSVGTPVQCGLPKLLALKNGVQAQIVARVRENLALVKGARHVEGGWYAILQVPRTKSEEQWVLDLLEHRERFGTAGVFL